HQASVESVAFSPDARLVLTGSEDKTAQFWDVATGSQCGPPLQHPWKIRNALFSPLGNTVLTAGCFNNVARLWEVAVPLGGTAERAVLWTRVITGMELDDTGALRILDSQSWHQCRQLL